MGQHRAEGDFVEELPGTKGEDLASTLVWTGRFLPLKEGKLQQAQSKVSASCITSKVWYSG